MAPFTASAVPEELPLHPTQTSHSVSDLLVENRLIAAVACVLEIPPQSITLIDSFTDLGGDEQSAHALQNLCLDAGLGLTIEDIVRCQTLAELKTRIMPSHQGTAPDADQVSPRLSADQSRHCRETSSGAPQAAMENRTLEQRISAAASVSGVAVVRPKAGFLEGKTVVFVSPNGDAGIKAGERSSIHIASQSQVHHVGGEVAAIRVALATQPCDAPSPDTWIVLNQIPTTPDGQLDRRKLQTWVQNMNEDKYRQVMRIETEQIIQEPVTDIERMVQEAASCILRIPPHLIGMNSSLQQLGGHEVSAMMLVASCRTRGISVPAQDVLRISLAHVASIASYHHDQAQGQWDDASTDEFALSPLQQLYLETASGNRLDCREEYAGVCRFNRSVLLRVNGTFALDDVHAAVHTLAGHHSMLRVRFTPGDDGWTQQIMRSVEGSYGFGHHTAQQLINIQHGPVFAVEYFRTGDGLQFLFMVAHQLVADYLSWNIIVRDCDELLTKGTLCSEQSMPFSAWVNLLAEDAMGTAGSSALASFELTPCDLRTWGLEESLNTYRESSEVTFIISSELTHILHTMCANVFRAEPTDIYIAVLLFSFTRTFPDRPPPTIWNQEHGRDSWKSNMDVAETVGWLAALCPVALRSTLDGNDDLLSVIREVKDTRRAISSHGYQHFALGFSGPFDEARCAEGWPVEIIFTYLGSSGVAKYANGVLEAVKLPEQESSGLGNFAPEVARLAIFEVNVSVDPRGSAAVGISFNPASSRQEKIAEWILAYEHFLYEAIGRLRYRPQELTLADVPLLNTDYQGLDEFNCKHTEALGLPSAQNIEDVLPATYTQEAFLSRSEFPFHCDNHTIHRLTFDNGNGVDYAHLCRAWEHIVAKYPALRTVFTDSIRAGGLFDQVILKRCSPDMLFLEPAPGENPIKAMWALPSMPANQGQPRHRISVCTSSSGTYLKVEASQAVCDLASLQLLVGELRRNYNSAKMPVNVLRPSHKSCLQHLYSASRPESLNYWQHRLRDAEPCLFPGIGPSTGSGISHSHFELGISPSLADEFCGKFAVDRGTLVRVAWGIALRVFTNANRVCFGFRTSGRDSANAPNGIQQSVGSFENIIPCSLDLSGCRTLEAVVRCAADDFGSCLPHQHTGLDEIEHAIGLGGERLFNTFLSYIEAPPALKSRFSSTRPQVETSCVELSGSLEIDSITLTATFVNGYLVCDISHPSLGPRLLSSAIHAFGEALNCIITNPFVSVGSLSLSTNINEALHGFSKLDVVEPCVHSLFGHHARRAPEAPAVLAGDGDLSYQSLAQLVQRLAGLLSDQGVRPGVSVVAILGKTKWSVVSILAILKAGGCFVPVDGEDQYMVEAVIDEVRPRVTLVTENLSPNLGLFVGGGVILVNASLFEGHRSAESPTRRASADDVACVLFPAGSSRSKELRGFMYSHVALSSAFLAQGKHLHLDDMSRVLQISSFSVDTSLIETLATLVHGGCICMPTRAERKSDIARAVRRMNVNWMYMTPLIARRLQPSGVPSLRVICFRTRGLDEDTCALWMRRMRVLLAYGCLEICPFGISVVEISRPENLDRIAQPFLGRCWVASPDDPSRLDPEGAIGELCIESPTIAQRFVPGTPLKPLAQFDDRTMLGGQKMVRFIKTSQSVRCVEDGTLEIISNAQRDIAINGKPVSSAKIEMLLRRCLGSDLEVTVETVMSRDGKQLLAAFIQLERTWKGPDDPACLDACMKERAYFSRHFAETSLGGSLPRHSMPSSFIPIRRLPVTSALKINRRKLRSHVRHLSEEEILAISRGGVSEADRGSGLFKPLPLTHVEERMRLIWADVLQVHQSAINPSADFPRRGGSKFLARTLVTRCREQGLKISIRDVLGGATFTQLCQGITLDSDISLSRCPEPIKQMPDTHAHLNVDEDILQSSVLPQLGVGRSDVLDCFKASPAQIRAIELGMLKGQGSFSYLVLNFSNLMSASQLEAACFGLCVIHPVLRTAFVRSGTQVYQVAARSQYPVFQRITCPAWRLGHIVDKVIRKDSSFSPTLATLPTRFFYLDAGKQSNLVVRMSKAQYDEASIPLIVQDLAQLYAGQRVPAGRPTYFDLVRSAQLACDGAGMNYWKSLLQNADMTQVIDWTAPSCVPAVVQKVERQITVGALSGLGITFDTVVKAAWGLVLATLSGRTDVVFGEVVDGRHLKILKGASAMGVVGPTQNIIPVRVKFGEQRAAPLDLLRDIQVQRASSSAYENTGWLDIVKTTAMPLWTRFSTAIHHRSLSQEAQDVKFDNATCTFGIQEPESQQDHDLLVTTSAVDSCKFNVSISFCGVRIPQAFAEETLESLCATIDLFTSVSMKRPLLPSARDLQSVQPRLPLPGPLRSIEPGQRCGNLHATQQFALQSLLAAVWTRAVNPQELRVPESQLHTSAFYDLCGNLLPAAEIADHITRELPRLQIPGAADINISMEDVVHHPTMMGQLDFLARKIQCPESPRRRLTDSFMPGSTAYLGRGIRRLATNARGHGRSAGEGCSPSAVMPAQSLIRSEALSRRQNSGVCSPGITSVSCQSPVHGTVAEKYGDESGPPPPQSAASKLEGRPVLTLAVHSSGSRSRGSMESLTTGTSGTEDEVDDVVMPLGCGPAVVRYSPCFETDLVSPLSPVGKSPLDVQPCGGVDETGLGIQGVGSIGDPAKEANTMRKRASNMFSKMGIPSPL